MGRTKQTRPKLHSKYRTNTRVFLWRLNQFGRYTKMGGSRPNRTCEYVTMEEMHEAKRLKINNEKFIHYAWFQITVVTEMHTLWYCQSVIGVISLELKLIGKQIKDIQILLIINRKKCYLLFNYLSIALRYHSARKDWLLLTGNWLLFMPTTDVLRYMAMLKI